MSATTTNGDASTAHVGRALRRKEDPRLITGRASYVDDINLTGQLWAFVIFRFFDMVKPPPIGYFDRRLKGGFGIMFDDLVAAFFTLLVIALWRMSV